MNETTNVIAGQDLLKQYGCGPIKHSPDIATHFTSDICYSTMSSIRSTADDRERFEPPADPVRDVPSQRWVHTDRIYDQQNPKRIYYLSMEFLIGRSLADNNVTNLLLDPFVQRAARGRDLDWLGLLEQEPDAGLGNGGLGRLAACFLDGWRRCSFRRWATVCATIRHVPAIHRRRLAA